MKRIFFPLLSISLCLSLSIPSFATDYMEEESKTDIVNAASFPDAAQISHWKAVAALAKLGLIIGKTDGAFHPTDTMTRAEAAKISSMILEGGREPIEEEYWTARFSDLEDHWAKDYIGYSAEAFIFSGRGDGRFYPDDQISGLELVKVALATVGYDSEEYKLLGDSWADQTDKLARYTTPSLYEELDAVDLTQPITRDNAAQIFYNALQVTAKVVAGKHFVDGQQKWRYVDDTRSDGSPASLLYRYFDLDSVEDLPEQPK